MNARKLSTLALLAAVGFGAVAGSIAVADPAKKDVAPAAAQEQPPQLPPAWTAEDMQAYAQAATPGKMHQHLAKDIGKWRGKSSMWMAPGGGEPMTHECTMNVSWLLDGRYLKGEMAGEMPGMGPYNGVGVMGFDNVAGEFVATWVDNHSTGIMTGTGELSTDGKTLTWNYNFHCPITKKPTVMRQVETWTGPNSKTLEMFAPDPKTGKEYQMMRIELTRKS
jgi:hypothetical protein